jgi:hypothetical protein
MSADKLRRGLLLGLPTLALAGGLFGAGTTVTSLEYDWNSHAVVSDGTLTDGGVSIVAGAGTSPDEYDWN